MIIQRWGNITDSDNWAIAIVALFIGIFLVAYVINGTKTNFRG